MAICRSLAEWISHQSVAYDGQVICKAFPVARNDKLYCDGFQTGHVELTDHLLGKMSLTQNAVFVVGVVVTGIKRDLESVQMLKCTPLLDRSDVVLSSER